LDGKKRQTGPQLVTVEPAELSNDACWTVKVRHALASPSQQLAIRTHKAHHDGAVGAP